MTEELKNAKKEVEQLQSEVFLLNDHSNKMEDELNGVKAAAALSEQDKQDVVQSLKQHYESQLQSLKEYADSMYSIAAKFEIYLHICVIILVNPSKIFKIILFKYKERFFQTNCYGISIHFLSLLL